MDHIAKKILQLTKPTLEKMLDEGISERELDCAEKMVRIAHDLIESDVLLCKLDAMRAGNGYEDEMMVNNPKKSF